MANDISLAMRRAVTERAGYCCEYCRMPEAELLAGCEVDHIISRKHGGLNDLANLALSCERCNRAKGTDAASVSGPPRKFIRLYNPRIDQWADHFRLEGARFMPVTEIGDVTVTLLRLNAPDRIIQRWSLQQVGAYPKV